MAQQPDFPLISKSFHTIANEIALLANLPIINDQQAAQNRHQELIDLLANVFTRLDSIDSRLKCIDEHLNRIDQGIAGK